MVGNGEGAIQVTENGQEYAGESSVKQQSVLVHGQPTMEMRRTSQASEIKYIIALMRELHI
jgi:hypothetical protein